MLVHQLIDKGEDERIYFHADTDISYSSLRTEVLRYQNYLYATGVRRNDNVGLLVRNSPAFVYAYMAVVSLGAVVVPINYQLTAQEIAFIIKDANIRNLIITKTLDIATPLSDYGYFTEVAQHLIDQINQYPIPKENLALLIDGDISEDQPCTIIYTSGTTGNPKGAVLTHKNLVSDATCFSRAMPVYENDNILCILPLYHCLAWTCIILCSLLHKASVTIVDTIIPKDVIEVIKRFDVTVMYGVPSVYMLLLKSAEPDDLARLRLFMSGGASLPQQVAENFQRKFGTGITEGYGLSEASPVVATNPQHKSKHLSIGKPIPEVTVRIVNPQGEDQPCGVVGELIVQGPNVMQGYFNLPEATAQTLRGGWLHTGDLAFQDNEAYLFIVDRLKDMIISSGENIYPREIEEVLYCYPGVIEAAVIGLPDDLRGQVACAYVVMAQGQVLDKKAIKEFLRGKLATFKIPRNFIQLDSLPKNQSGKIMKRTLREQQKDRERVAKTTQS